MYKALVLIIDPCRDTRAIYAHYLRHHGYEVAEAANGAEGVRLVRQLSPDVVVTELTLPVVSGLNVVRMIRMREPAEETIIIACATNIDRVWPYAPPGAEVDSALAKPASPRSLLLEIEHQLAYGRTFALVRAG